MGDDDTKLIPLRPFKPLPALTKELLDAYHLPDFYAMSPVFVRRPPRFYPDVKFSSGSWVEPPPVRRNGRCPNCKGDVSESMTDDELAADKERPTLTVLCAGCNVWVLPDWED